MTDNATFVPESAAGLEQGSSGDEVQRVQDYLKQFGYFDAEGLNGFSTDEVFVRSTEVEPDFSTDHVLETAPAAESGSFDSATTDAVERFQEFAGLAVTGVVDDATLAKMNTRRCGNRDHTGPAEFVTGIGKWETTNLTYSFQNYGADMSASSQRWAIDQAFGMWSAETPLRFRRVADGTGGDIVIRFVDDDHGDGFPFDGAGGVLAHAFFPSNAGSIRGDSHFDEDEQWTVNVPTGTGVDLVTVAAHEFGHALGLAHSGDNTALMAPFYGGPRRFLSPDDIQGIQSLYGGPGSLENATWVHGNAAVIERPASVEFQRHYGFFNRIIGKPNTTNWVHFSLPTPVIEDGARLILDRFMLRARTGNAAILRDVHIRDGERVVALHNFVNQSGSMGFEKFGVASMPPVRWGTSISLGFTFDEGSAGDRRVDLISAGMDYKK